jgi:glycosyltransferase involved in cell wall biosynthesis
VRVAYFSPLPPERSGIADYSALLLPALERRIDVEVVRRGRTRPVAADVSLYHIGNDPDAHAWIVEALRRQPGVVVLHDFVLHHLVAGLTVGRRDGPGYLAALERDAGVPGRLLGHGVLEGRVAPLWETRPDEFPLVGDILRDATGLIVHSRFVARRSREAGFDGPIWRVPHPAWPMGDVTPAELEGRPLFGCFGHLNASKRIPQLVEAFATVRRRHPDAKLLLVGPASPNFDASRFHGDGIERIDYVPERQLWSLMARCDACVLLRAPTMGETSGSAIRALTLGRPLVVTDVGWFSELPDDVALKVPLGDDEVPALAASLELLASSEATQRAMSAAARGYVRREHDLDAVADRYVAALEEAAGGGAVADAVVDEVARAAADVGITPGTPVAHDLAVRLDELGLARNGRPEPPPAPRESPIAVLPVWAWLAGAVLMSFALRWWLAGRLVAPWIMVDELIYSELAKSFAATGHFLIRDQHHGAYGVVYPLVISPAWKLFASVPAAYAAAKVIGSFAMSLTAVPAYFLARRLVRPLPSLLVAVLAVAVPSMVYTGTVMTETVFYPLFVCVALALVLALERPTILRQAVLLAVCVVAFLTRSQAVALFAAIATAPLVLAWLDRRERVLRSFRFLYGALAAIVVAVLVVQLARGRSPYDVFGSYSVTGHTHYRVGDVLRWLVYHLAELDLYVAVIPFAAFLLLVAVSRTLDRRVQIFAAAAASLTAWLAVEVAAFASRLPVPPRVEERNLFYVVPLLLLALVVWIERGMPRPPRAAAVCAAVAAALPGLLPFDRLIDTPAQSDTLALIPLWWIQDAVVSTAEIPLLVVVAAIVLACAFLLLRPRYAYVLPFVVLAWFVFATERIEHSKHGFIRASKGALFEGFAGARPDWVDRAVGRNADVAFIWSNARGNGRVIEIWENEFFNRSIGPVYDLAAPSPGDLPETRIHRNPDGTFSANGQRVRPAYILGADYLHLAGPVVRSDARRGLELRRTAQPLHVAYRISGLYADMWSSARFTYTRYRCTGGHVTVAFSGDAGLSRGRQTVSAGGRSASIVPPETGSLTVPLRPAALGICRAEFVVAPTHVPARVQPGSHDTRTLGVRVTAVRYTP